MTGEELQEVITKASLNFGFFIDHIFSLSFPKGFVSGQYVHEIADFMQSYRYTARQSPRDHFKSTGLHAYAMWRIFRFARRDTKDFYFSFKQDMAQYHIGEIKRYMALNPFFERCRDRKKTAEFIIECTWDGKHVYRLTPHGIMSAVRGLHGDAIFIDDPFKDPQNRMMLTNIFKVNDAFEDMLIDIPDKLTGEIHIVGTPQSHSDFFYNDKLLSNYGLMMRPAIEDEAAGKALWPEWLTFEELVEIRKRRPRSFPREFMIKPAMLDETYFNPDELYGMVNKELPHYTIMQKLEPEHTQYRNQRIGAIDIGKKRHPSHFVVYEKVFLKDEHGNVKRDEHGNAMYKIQQMVSKWMDRWNYTNGMKGAPEDIYDTDNPTQIEFIKLMQKNLNIDTILFDNTNGVWEGFLEQGVLDRQKYKPIHFTSKSKNEMATAWDKEVKGGKIEMLNDPRGLRQILAVNNELQAVETEEGHGDSFWSNAMAIYGFRDKPQTRAFTHKPKGF